MTTLSLAVNAAQDLFVGPDGALATTTDLAAVMQAAQHAAQTLLGEMIYATDAGIPYFDVVWNGNPNLAQFEAYLRRAILAVEGVTRITDLSVTPAGNTLTYRATIQTVYGTGTLNG